MSKIKYTTFDTSVEFEQWQEDPPQKKIFGIYPIIRELHGAVVAMNEASADTEIGILVTYHEIEKENNEET
jgi:hypothetical protein